MSKRNRPRKPKPPRGASGPPPHLASHAAAEALRRAALAASAGKLTAADREMRVAERLSKLAAIPFLQSDSEEPSPEDFRRELEQRINRHRASQRAALDEMKRRDPAAWAAAFDAAMAQAIAQARETTIAFWTGDPHLFAEQAPSENAGIEPAYPTGAEPGV
jgi:hypothetical protein